MLPSCCQRLLVQPGPLCGSAGFSSGRISAWVLGLGAVSTLGSLTPSVWTPGSLAPDRVRPQGALVRLPGGSGGVLAWGRLLYETQSEPTAL